MEVAEQGISGTKSQPKASDEPIMKEDKVLSPASRRVREAAEALLSCIMEQERKKNILAKVFRVHLVRFWCFFFFFWLGEVTQLSFLDIRDPYDVYQELGP